MENSGSTKKSFANRDSVPTLLPDLYSGTLTVPELWLGFLKKGLCSDKFSVRTVLGRCACTECERWVKDERIRDLCFLFLLHTSPKSKRKSQNEPKTMVPESAFF